MKAEDKAPAINSWKRKSGNLVDARYTPNVFEAPKIATKSLCLTSPNICEKIIVAIITNAADRMLVCLAKRRLRLLLKKSFGILMLFFTV